MQVRRSGSKSFLFIAAGLSLVGIVYASVVLISHKGTAAPHKQSHHAKSGKQPQHGHGHGDGNHTLKLKSVQESVTYSHLTHFERL
jgi:hypothetical protein